MTRIAAGLGLLLVVAWVANAVVKGFLLALVQRVAKRTKGTWDDRLVEHRVFQRLANVAPALVVYYGIGVALGLPPEELASAEGLGVLADGQGTLVFVALLARRVALAWIVLSLALAFGAFLAAVDDIYRESYEEARNRPIKGYLQVVAIFVYVAAGIVMIAIVADRSPLVFLSGLGALTAVLLLVFRDTILSLVASVQIMSNDMIRIGDWVEMPQAHADGDVVDIALHTVKIQNWDKTYTTVPTHKFISESFRNWRGMSESGGRRIKRALYLDVNSVRFLDEEEVRRLGRYELLQDYMAAKREELAQANPRGAGAGDGSPAGAHDGGDGTDGTIPHVRRLTNVGTFRAYVFAYLERHPGIHDGMTLLVRQLPPGPEGLPLEIYAFAADTAWARYEGLQADIFDHLLAILPEFGLQAFQQPTGSDLAGLAERA